jgi:hypothetical protein
VGQFCGRGFRLRWGWSGRSRQCVHAPNGSLSHIFTVTAEVYTESSFGRYKTTLIALPFDSAPIVPDSYLAAFSAGINVRTSQRTNIGSYNPCVDATVSVQALIYSSDGKLVQTITFDLPPESWKQLPISATVTNGSIRWSSTLPVYQYAVEVDNISNDGSLNLAVEYAP